MSSNFIPTLLTVPIELVYRIFDHLDILTIFLSLRNVCTRLNSITECYHRYKVKLQKILLYNLLKIYFLIFLYRHVLNSIMHTRQLPMNRFKIQFMYYQLIRLVLSSFLILHLPSKIDAYKIGSQWNTYQLSRCTIFD